MNTVLAKCSCGHCDGHIEFDTGYAGERVACPHCGRETRLYIPDTAIAPPIPDPVPAPIAPAVQSTCRLADPIVPRTLTPRPTAAPLRNAPPRDPSPFARQAAKASWISFIFAYAFSALARQPEGATMRPVFLITVPLFLLIGLTLGIIALLGIRRYGTKGIRTPAIVGLVLNGMYLGAILIAIVTGLINRHEQHETNRKAAVSVADFAKQRQSGALIKQMQRTGNADLDAYFQIVVDLDNKLTGVIEQTDAELGQLQEMCVSLVLTNKAAIKSELSKRTAAQAIIQKYEREAAAAVESARQRCLALEIPDSLKQTVLRALDKGGQVQANLDQTFSLRARLRNTECDLLQFMHREFGHYRIIGEDAWFAAPANQAKYAHLCQRVKDVLQNAEGFDRRRSEMLEAITEQMEALAK